MKIKSNLLKLLHKQDKISKSSIQRKTKIFSKSISSISAITEFIKDIYICKTNMK
jgi:hypothetical protein